MVITEGRRHDVKVAKELDLPLMADSIVSVDRAYMVPRFNRGISG
jgi:hypothetical protein